MPNKTQTEVVIDVLKHHEGIATLGRIIRDTLDHPDFHFTGRTPDANIRRIVQTHPEAIFKIRPGLYGLLSYKDALIEQKLITRSTHLDDHDTRISHAYYQGLLLELGNYRNFQTFAPQQDKNQLYVDRPLYKVRSLDAILEFSYPNLVKRAQTIDTIWFNERGLPNSFFEVENSTDIQNSLLKFNDLQDFYVRMVIVAHESKRTKFESLRQNTSFAAIKDRVTFCNYETLVRDHTYQITRQQGFI